MQYNFSTLMHKDDDDMIFTDYVLRMFQEDEIIHIETDRVQKTETFIIL